MEFREINILELSEFLKTLLKQLRNADFPVLTLSTGQNEKRLRDGIPEYLRMAASVDRQESLIDRRSPKLPRHLASADLRSEFFSASILRLEQVKHKDSQVDLPALEANRPAEISEAVWRDVHYTFAEVDGETGLAEQGYSARDLVRTWQLARGRMTAELCKRVDDCYERKEKRAKAKLLGSIYGDRPTNMKDAGWALLTPEGMALGEIPSLEKLQAHRKRYYGIMKERVKHLVYQSGESFAAWSTRLKIAPGIYDSEKVPYYILIIGTPESIPYSFEVDLSYEYIVGRLPFEDEESIGRYVEQVTQNEDTPPQMGPCAVWAPQISTDQSTLISAKRLADPLCSYLGDEGIPLTECRGVKADKARFLELLSSRPRLLIAATHGVRWKVGSPKRQELQGALVTQDWSGYGPLRETQMVGPKDIAAMDLGGTVALLFACYSVGTPPVDIYAKSAPSGGEVVSPLPSALACQMLTHGCLSVIGHLDRARAYSLESDANKLPPTYQALVSSILRQQQPIGLSVRHLKDRAAALSARLLRSSFWTEPTEQQLDDWFELQDAENFLLLGDPAARVSL